MGKLPLEDVRVIDFTTVWAGPHITQWLGVMGAEIIKIETSVRPDTQRTMGGGSGRPPPKSLNESVGFATLNYSKKGVVLNMTQPRAVQLVRELVKISDIVAENFGGAVMDRWGLGYSELKKLKPDIIVYAGSGYGRTGPFKEAPAYAPVIDAFGGLTAINGYLGGEPSTIGTGGWTDLMQALHGAFAILSALHHRSETGEGQYIDLAMTEASANFLGELVMGYTMNEKVGELVGNQDEIMAPHGCYRCLGEDEWVSIAVSSDEEWKAFCNAIGNPDWTKREEFRDELSRWKNQGELDKLVQEWTKKHHHYEAMEMLQKAGLMAGACLNTAQLMCDPHLREREFFVDMVHPAMGKLRLPGLPWMLSNTPRGNYNHAPLLGEHNDYVFGELLGLPKEEIKRLEEEKVIY